MQKYFAYLKYRPLWHRFRSLTMCGKRRFVANLAVIEARARRVDLSQGSYVECGTWRGGMSFAAMQLPTGIKEYKFFDSYEGLPPATEKDGERAISRQRDGKLQHNNNTADVEDFTANLDRFRRPGQQTEINQGWFDATLPHFNSERPIAVLRMDGDWYDSTMCILQNLFDRVMPGGLIIIDDYYDWVGCSRAVHDFLAKRQADERVRETPIGQVAYLIKEGGEA